jgi:hypothetical protein
MSLTSRADYEKELYSVINAYFKKICTENFSNYTRNDIENMAIEFGGNNEIYQFYLTKYNKNDEL